MAALQRKGLGQVLLRHKALHCSLRQCLAAISTFNFQDLQVTLTQVPQAKPDEKELLFGHNFTDHMLTIDWSAKQGWGKPWIHPVQELRIHPAAKVLHYATELFEGMKGYRCTDGKIRLFRPMENMKRMRRSAERAGLPDFDAGELLRCIKKLITIDNDWVPRADKCSLYVRPTFIGTETLAKSIKEMFVNLDCSYAAIHVARGSFPTLGVSKSAEAKLFVLLSPVGPYFRTGFKPVTLLADPTFVRAWPGGCGSFKMGANYAPTIQIQDHAMREMGCQQVLWLFGDDHQLTEVGTMNLFMYWINEQGEEELVTPPLHGLILPGVTRKSLLELSREWNEFQVAERDITMKEVIRGLKENRVMEMFGAGTACVVCPIEKIMYQREILEIPTMKTAKLTNRFFSYLADIQYGRIPHLWMEPVDEDAEVDVDLKASRM